MYLQPKAGSKIYIGQNTSTVSTVQIKSNAGTSGGGAIYFNAPVLSGSAVNHHNLTLAAGTGRIQFSQYLGALPGTPSYDTSNHLGTIVIESGMVTKATSSDFFIAAENLTLGTAASPAVIDTAGDTVKHITFRVNGLVKHNTSNIKAGDGIIPRPWGRFKIYPLTPGHTIEYAPVTSGGGYDVYYSSAWDGVLAESFTVGDLAHTGDITINNVNNTAFELIVQNGNTGTIIIKNNYSSQNKPLTMQSGSGGIVLQGNGSNASVNLGTAAFSVASSSKFTLQHLSTGTITALGGITLGVITADTQSSPAGATNFTLNAGTAPITITGDIGANSNHGSGISTRLGAFTVASSGQITLGGSMYTRDNITFTVSNANRNLLLTSAGQTEISSSSGYLIFTGNATLTHSGGLYLNTLFNGASPVELTLNAAAANKTVMLRSGGSYALPNADRLIFAGLSQNFNANGATLPARTRLALAAAAVLTLDTSDVTQPAGELHIQSGALNLNTKKWEVGGSALSGFLVGASSGLIMAANTALTTQGGVTAASGSTLSLDPASKIVFAAGAQSLSIPATSQLGSIEIAANTELTLASDITVTGNWSQWGRNAFIHDDNSVTISGERTHDIKVGDANTPPADREIIWKRLIAQTPGMTLRFDNWPAKHTVLEELRIEGSAGAPIKLTRLTGGVTPPPRRPANLIAGTAAHTGFWYLDPPDDPGGAGTISVKDLYVEYGFVKHDEPIEPPLNVSVTPYYTASAEQGVSHYTVNWLRRNIFIYTWAEDSDGNGQIDRIRAQMPPQYQPQGSISTFKPIVEGYTVTGCEWVPGYGPGGANASNGYMIYIHLKESGLPDTGAAPQWRVDDSQLTPEGAALFIMAGADKLPLDIYDAMETIDTAPPRIAYTLSVPGKNEVYVKMSETISAASLSGLAGRTFGKAISSAHSVSESELLLTIDSSFTAEALLHDIYSDAAFTAVTDRARNYLPGDPFYHKEPVKPLYPTHYEADVHHTASAAFVQVTNSYEDGTFPSGYGGTLTQANRYVSKTGEHRAADLLVLRPARTPTELILWPIYAKDASGRSHARDDGGIGTAVKYNGSEKLRPTGSTGGPGTDQPGILVEAAANQFIQGGSPPQILYSFDVDPMYRQQRETEGAPPEFGVWLPQIPADDPANNITPRPLAVTAGGSVQNGGSCFFRVSDQEVAGHATLEFIFKIGTLYAVRLDSPDGSIPDGWYHRLRTFAVNFQELQRQRGGVTVLNNVINPVKGEIAALNYRITRGGAVTIQVFTMDGTLVKQIERGSKSSGDYTVSWDGKNEGGRPVARGMYFIRAVAPDIDEIRKVMVVK